MEVGFIVVVSREFLCIGRTLSDSFVKCVFLE